MEEDEEEGEEGAGNKVEGKNNKEKRWREGLFLGL